MFKGTKILASINKNINYLDKIKQVLNLIHKHKAKFEPHEFYIIGANTLPVYLSYNGGNVLSFDEIEKKLKDKELGRLVDLVIRKREKNPKEFYDSLYGLGFVNHYGDFIYSFF